MTVNSTNPMQMGMGSIQGPRDGSGPRGAQEQQIQDQTQQDQQIQQRKMQDQQQMQAQQQNQQQSQMQQDQQQQVQQQVAASTGMGGMLNLMA